MAVPALYEICLRETETLLRSGRWRDCCPNVFSNLTSRIVNELMTRVASRHVNGGRGEPIKLPDLLVLLGSEKLTHLRLNSLGTEQEYDLFLQKIQMFPNFCKHIRIITLHLFKDVKSSLIETLIRICPKLEELDSTIIPPNFELFKNCKALKILRFRSKLGPLRESVDISCLACLGGLETVSFEDMDSDITFKVLQHCQNLNSILSNDSLRALKRHHENLVENHSSSTLSVRGPFQLKKCVWRLIPELPPGIDFNCLQNWATLERSKEISTFSEKIRCAVSLCPLVEDLTICPLKGESLRELKNLKKLEILKIDFLFCKDDDDYLPYFNELLREIGHQLKFLFIVSEHPISVDIICEWCPNLLTLDIHGNATVDNPTPKNPNLPLENLPLEKLRVTSADQESLLHLLSNCKRLENLIMGNVLCFDDCLLDRVLKVNPLANLKEIAFSECTISREGFRSLLQKTHCLQRILTTEHLFKVVKSLIDEMKLIGLRIEYFRDLAMIERCENGQIGMSHFTLDFEDLNFKKLQAQERNEVVLRIKFRLA